MGPDAGGSTGGCGCGLEVCDEQDARESVGEGISIHRGVSCREVGEQAVGVGPGLGQDRFDEWSGQLLPFVGIDGVDDGGEGVGGSGSGASAGLGTCSVGGRQVTDRLPTGCRQGVDRVPDGCRSLWGQHFVAIVRRGEAQHFLHLGHPHAQPEGHQVFQRRRQPLDVGGVLATDGEAGVCLAGSAIERDDGDDEIAAQGGSELTSVAALDVAPNEIVDGAQGV